ncbi:hypothetical protein BC833DRAFT_599670 [Globomyces pollinis-pini]|nr:hypothetical protein BC833DRAFT_599670 [Globomyces pollinis-pini]
MHHQKSKSVSFPTSSQIIETHDDILDYIKSEAEKFVTTFNLANRNLVRIPVEIHLLTQLERLGLNNNRLTSLPIQLNSLLQLRYLNLRSNSLKEFPIIVLTQNSLNTSWVK